MSTFTFIVPVSEMPVSNAPEVVNNSALITLADNQESAGIATVEKDIQAVLDRLPDSEDAEFLQDGLETTLARLDTATNDQQAQAIIDEEVSKLSKEFAAAPNPERVTDILLDIRDARPTYNAPLDDFQSGFDPAQRQSKLNDLLMSAGLQLNQRSGWLS